MCLFCLNNASRNRFYTPCIQWTQQRGSIGSETEIPQPRCVFLCALSRSVTLLTRRMHPAAIFYHFKDPVMITDGHMQYLFDEKGKRYLDLFAGIVTVSVGHCHPRVNAAVIEQTKRLQHTTTIYLNNQIAEYAKELADKMPGNLKNVYFVNSGTEANELALLMARLYTGNYDMIALRNAYHGISESTLGALGLHTWKYNVPSGFGIIQAMNPEGYRGRFGTDVNEYVQDLAELIQCSTSGSIAGFIAETIQGVGGAVPLLDGYLKRAYEVVRQHGGVCIADEVQTGFGRTGTKYFGFENQGVIPDIVTMAKGIGNGLPLAAVVTTPEIASTLKRKLHFNTFGGNPVSSAAGRAVLKVIEEDKLQENSHAVGTYLLEKLSALKRKHDIIGDVRGKGLMVGVELVKDRTTKNPAVEETAHIFEKAKDMGVLLGKGGLFGNVFRIKPPMCISKQDVDYLIHVMDESIQSL